MRPGRKRTESNGIGSAYCAGRGGGAVPSGGDRAGFRREENIARRLVVGRGADRRTLRKPGRSKINGETGEAKIDGDISGIIGDMKTAVGVGAFSQAAKRYRIGPADGSSGYGRTISGIADGSGFGGAEGIVRGLV